MEDVDDMNFKRRMMCFLVHLSALSEKYGVYVAPGTVEFSDLKPLPKATNIFSDGNGHHFVSTEDDFDYYGKIFSISPAEMDSLVSELRLREKTGISTPHRGGL